MSNETATPKKSILTRAMEMADDRKGTNDKKELTPEEIAAKRSLRNARIFATAMVATFAVTAVTIYRTAKDETPSEETATED